MLSSPRLLTAGQMARRLRVPTRWLKNEASAGKIPHVQAEKVFLFDPEAVEEALVQRAREPKEARIA